jgi:hypothetical protein
VRQARLVVDRATPAKRSARERGNKARVFQECAPRHRQQRAQKQSGNAHPASKDFMEKNERFV